MIERRSWVGLFAVPTPARTALVADLEAERSCVLGVSPAPRQASLVATSRAVRIAVVTFACTSRRREQREIAITAWRDTPVCCASGEVIGRRRTPDWARLLPGYHVEHVGDSREWRFEARRAQERAAGNN